MYLRRSRRQRHSCELEECFGREAAGLGALTRLLFNSYFLLGRAPWGLATVQGSYVGGQQILRYAECEKTARTKNQLYF